MKRLTALLVLLTFLPFASGLIWIQPARFTTGGGGSPAWVDSVAVGSLTAGYAPAPDVVIGSSALVADQSGNVTKLRAYNYSGTATTLKIALYDASFNLIVGANWTGSAGVGWVEVSVTPSAVTASTSYRIFAVSGLTDFTFGYQASQPADSGRFEGAVYHYTTWGPPNPISVASDTSRWALGMYIEP
jgi:hypothetical protein